MTRLNRTLQMVRGPRGELLTAEGLPKQGERWTATRKAQVLLAVRGGLISLPELKERCGIEATEVAGWGEAYDKHGLIGLRTTYVQRNEGRARKPNRLFKE